MAVKVKCRDCGTVAAVPDAARGKSVKCKDCGASIKVPSAAGGGPAKKAAAKKEKTIEDDDFFNHLDLDRVEDEEKRICPKCAAKVTDEDIECPSCGINLETGQLSTKQAQRKKFIAQGRDPDKFFKVAWSDPFEFMKANISLCLTLAGFSAFAFTIYFCCQFLAFWYEKLPLKFFFAAISVVGFLASVGCFIQLYIHVIKNTLDDKKELGRFNFDFFADVALGLKILVWPFAVTGPVQMVLGVIGAAVMLFGLLSVNLDAGVGLALASGTGLLMVLMPLGLYLVGTLTFPIAISHMSAKYTYKAYLPNQMFPLMGRNFAAVAYWWLIAIALNLVVMIAAFALGYFMTDVMELYLRAIAKILELAEIKNWEDENQRGFLFYVIFPLVGFPLVFITTFILTLPSSFAAVFLTRLTGLFAYYNQPKLGMSEKRVAGQPAGFWPRYLGYLIDAIVLSAFVGFAQFMVAMMALLASELGLEGMEPMFATLTQIVSGLIPLLYYMLSESGPGGATLGKSSMGMIVVNEAGKKPITKGQALSRYFLRGIVGFGVFFALWDKDKMTLHDKMTKTRVVWRPEQLI